MHIQKRHSTTDPYIMLFGRTVLLALVGLVMWGIFSLFGNNPVDYGIHWWPFQVILANLLCFGLLTKFAAKEKLRFIDLLGFNKKTFFKDLGIVLLCTPIIIISGGVGLYGSSLVIFGTLPPTTMFQPMPVWAAIVSLLLFPLTNALVELTTYYGYALPRLEKTFPLKWFPLFLAAFMLSFQHTAFPLVPEWKYFLWRMIGFLPLAIAIGLIYKKLKRVGPLTIGHYFMDLQLILMVLFASIK